MNGDDRSPDPEGPWSADEETRRRLDDLLTLLAGQRRRDLLYHLSVTEITDVETLASKMGAASEGVPVDEVSTEDRRRIQIELVHTHLPKLVDAGAIEFDRRTGVVRCRELPPKLRHLVEACGEIETG